MSVIGSNILAGASGQGGGYNLTNSLRFRSSASAYLSRTLTTPTSAKAWTFSAWIKRGKLGSGQSIFISTLGGAGVPQASSYFTSSDTIQIYDYTGSAYTFDLTTTQVFRDTSAWYHLMFVYDSANATASNRVKLYVNGSAITAFSSASYPTQNADCAAFNRAYTHYLSQGNAQYFDGYMAEVNFIDGQALDASSFGETSATTGVWIPKKYTGTYGTNGFYLPFTDNSALTTSSNAGLGKDFSGNSNYWTTNNISITSGSTYDSMTDVPTLTSTTAANYAVLNPLDSGATNSTISNGNLTVATASTGYRYMGNTIWAVSGKFYAEFTLTATTGYAQVGIATTTTSTDKTLGQDSTSWSYNSWNGTSSNNNSASSFGNSWTTNDVIGIALDKDNNKLYFSKNGTWQNSADPAAGTGSLNIASIAGLATLIGVCDNDNGGSVTFQVNFGQRPFTYTPPTGFVALNTFNLPTSTIVKGNTVMDAITYTGTGSTQTISSLAFQPNFLWIKNRTTAADHYLYDSIRGAGYGLYSNLTNAEYYESTQMSAFTSTGFTVNTGGATNGNTNALVAWAWNAGNNTTSSNTNGSITSTVSANTTAGFSIVTYNTGSAGNQTVGHGLGVTPAMIIIKSRATSNWDVWHKSFANPAQGYMYLNLTNAVANDARNWANTAPTSTVFSYESGYEFAANQNYVAYCFSEVAGYSAFGSYTGNGSSDGTFVHLGFRPKFVMIKRTDSSDDWILLDTSRSAYNVSSLTLYANGSYAEDSNVTNRSLDFLSNGFKIRSSGVYINASGGNFIYMAFAENPTKYSLAR